MSATYRYDLGLHAYHAMEKMLSERGLIAPLGLAGASRWAGVHRRRKQCVTFSLKLPSQVDLMWQLRGLVRTTMAVKELDAQAYSSLIVLDRKLTLGLGLPWVTDDIKPTDGAFMAHLAEHPGDLGAWAAYADWLVENHDPDPDVAEYWKHSGSYEASRVRPRPHTRGLLIAGWLADKPAIKVKLGGVPMILLGEDK